MKLKNEICFLSFVQALNQQDEELKNFLKSLYFHIIETYSPEKDKEEKEKLFESWYEGLDGMYDNLLETLEAYGRLKEFENIISKYIPQAEKVKKIYKI